MPRRATTGTTMADNDEQPTPPEDPSPLLQELIKWIEEESRQEAARAHAEKQ